MTSERNMRRGFVCAHVSFNSYIMVYVYTRLSPLILFCTVVDRQYVLNLLKPLNDRFDSADVSGSVHRIMNIVFISGNCLPSHAVRHWCAVVGNSPGSTLDQNHFHSCNSCREVVAFVRSLL